MDILSPFVFTHTVRVLVFQANKRKYSMKLTCLFGFAAFVPLRMLSSDYTRADGGVLTGETG